MDTTRAVEKIFAACYDLEQEVARKQKTLTKFTKVSKEQDVKYKNQESAGRSRRNTMSNRNVSTDVCVGSLTWSYVGGVSLYLEVNAVFDDTFLGQQFHQRSRRM